MPEFIESQFTDEQRTIRDKLQQEWRMDCPEGHVQLDLNKVPTVYCCECQGSYAYEELFDRS